MRASEGDDANSSTASSSSTRRYANNDAHACIKPGLPYLPPYHMHGYAP
jgi:hypothetical protein